MGTEQFALRRSYVGDVRGGDSQRRSLLFGFDPKRASIAFQHGCANKINQTVGLEGLFYDSRHAEPCGPCRCPCVELARDQNRRAANPFPLQVGDELEPGHTRHVLVDDQACRRPVLTIGEEFASRAARPHVKSEGFEQHLQRLGEPFVVIDDINWLVGGIARPV